MICTVMGGPYRLPCLGAAQLQVSGKPSCWSCYYIIKCTHNHTRKAGTSPALNLPVVTSPWVKLWVWEFKNEARRCYNKVDGWHVVDVSKSDKFGFSKNLQAICILRTIKSYIYGLRVGFWLTADVPNVLHLFCFVEEFSLRVIPPPPPPTPSARDCFLGNSSFAQ